jgi:hypothetical protein
MSRPRARRRSPGRAAQRPSGESLPSLQLHCCAGPLRSPAAGGGGGGGTTCPGARRMSAAGGCAPDHEWLCCEQAAPCMAAAGLRTADGHSDAAASRTSCTRQDVEASCLQALRLQEVMLRQHRRRPPSSQALQRSHTGWQPGRQQAGSRRRRAPAPRIPSSLPAHPFPSRLPASCHQNPPPPPRPRPHLLPCSACCEPNTSLMARAVKRCASWLLTEETTSAPAASARWPPQTTAAAAAGCLASVLASSCAHSSVSNLVAAHLLLDATPHVGRHRRVDLRMRVYVVGRCRARAPWGQLLRPSAPRTTLAAVVPQPVAGWRAPAAPGCEEGRQQPGSQPNHYHSSCCCYACRRLRRPRRASLP